MIKTISMRNKERRTGKTTSLINILREEEQTNYYDKIIVICGMRQIEKTLDSDIELVEYDRLDMYLRGKRFTNCLILIDEPFMIKEEYQNHLLLTLIKDPSRFTVIGIGTAQPKRRLFIDYVL